MRRDREKLLDIAEQLPILKQNIQSILQSLD